MTHLRRDKDVKYHNGIQKKRQEKQQKNQGKLLVNPQLGFAVLTRKIKIRNNP